MGKLSVIIPSRDEQFLIPTIDDIFAHAKGDTEVVAVIDSDKWPAGWKEVTDRHPRLHTLHNGQSLGMRAAINRGVASAMSRGADYVMKLDGHCSLSEGFDITLLEEIEDNWVVVPRRGRLDPEAWTATDTHKPDIDYHYLSFPDDPNDFGGPGLNGKVWDERAVQRKDIEVDEEMSSQGSCWLTSVANFQRLELMDEASYGKFWNEMQEIGLKCWLSGGKLMVNKRAKYLHLHKGKKYGRGYKLPESALTTGRNHTMLWLWNEAWPKQTLPFKWLIEHFWPVPTWPENWEEILYAKRQPVSVPVTTIGVNLLEKLGDAGVKVDDVWGVDDGQRLQIHSAEYGPLGTAGTDKWLDVTSRIRELVRNNSLDIVVNNSTITPGENPFRGKKKTLAVQYSYYSGRIRTITRDEKDWLIIGQAQERGPSAFSIDSHERHNAMMSGETAELVANRDGKLCPYCNRRFTLVNNHFPVHAKSREDELREVNPTACEGSGKELSPVVTVVESERRREAQMDEPLTMPTVGEIKRGKTQVVSEGKLHDVALGPASVKKVYVDGRQVSFAQVQQPMSAPALNDYLIRKFSISDRRLRAPMPIELRDFHRDDLAQLFAELGFRRGAEVGVAEGIYSEILLKANPKLELYMVDPWHAYSDNPQNKSKEKHEYAYQETLRRTQGYKMAIPIMQESMEYVQQVVDGSLDFVYIDGNHSFDYVMQDLIEWSKRVRSGGIVSGDDYYALDEKRWGAGPVEAVQAYMKAHRIPIWFICDAHKSVDFFWVKP